MTFFVPDPDDDGFDPDDDVNGDDDDVVYALYTAEVNHQIGGSVSPSARDYRRYRKWRLWLVTTRLNIQMQNYVEQIKQKRLLLQHD